MKSGRELDVLVAEKVFGMHRHPGCDLDDHLRAECYGTGTEEGYGPVVDYSTDIAAAWLVVEKLGKDGDEHPACIHKGLPAFGDHATPFEVYKNYAGYPGWTCYFADYEVSAHADTAPLAICLAALKAVGVEVEE